MSYTSNTNANILQGTINSNPIQNFNALGNAVSNITTTNGYATANGYTGISINTTGAFKMEMYKSENGGFVLNLITMNPNTYQDIYKLFILNDIQNMGRDIQNILAAEILKS